MGFFWGAAVAPEPAPTDNRGGVASTSSSNARPTALHVGRRDTLSSEELDDEDEAEMNGAGGADGLSHGPHSPGGGEGGARSSRGPKDSAGGGGPRSPGGRRGGGSILRSPRGSEGSSKRSNARLTRKSTGWSDVFGSKHAALDAELDEELDLESTADLPGMASEKPNFQRLKSKMVVSNPDEVTGVKVRSVNARFEPFLHRDSEGDRQESPTLPPSLAPTGRYMSMVLPRSSESRPLGNPGGSSNFRSGKSVTGPGAFGGLGALTGKQPSMAGPEPFEKGMVLRAVAQLAALRRKSLTMGPQRMTLPSSRMRRNTADSEEEPGEDEELGAFHYSRTRVINPKSAFITRWDIFLTILIIICAFTIPFEAAFLHLSLNSIFFANRVVDAIFLVDMLINFNLMFFDNEKSVWISKRKTIAARYLRTSFTTDFLAVFPFDVIYYCWEKYSMHHSKRSVIGIILRLGRLLKVGLTSDGDV
ncbi:potassium channel [Klebsormidium nitens]|uniref:Potassium channel n=1 Tax=Klebsormidium nitens TaxID=105231 RepID=A0A1Y1HX32_KLENI|nr:potassium channel [Klebsormidium nitens]|eukprot:GAQ82342.1 potassium channel [Klebsormidium nitens]